MQCEKEQAPTDKIKALENFKAQARDDPNGEALYRALCRYYAAKLVRNHINHASEINANKTVIDYLNSEPEHYFEVSKAGSATEELKAIRHMMEEGLKANEKLKELIKCQTV